MNRKIFIVGGGAIGFSLAVHLTAAGKDVTVLRVGGPATVATSLRTAVRTAEAVIVTQNVVCRSLADEKGIEGVVVVATKAPGNRELAEVLAKKALGCELLVMQNGIGVERQFCSQGFRSVSRCVVYMTAEKIEDGLYSARMIKPSPIGTLQGNLGTARDLVSTLSTQEIGFYEEKEIQREVWKKGVINAAFNSICPLLEVDNGVFSRDASVLVLAAKLVAECVPVANRLGLSLDADDVINEIVQISSRSSGQLISTLQDIRHRRETEIGYLNMEISRIAEGLTPALELPLTKLLGELTLKKSQLAREGAH